VDNVGGGVARLDVDVHVLDIVVVVRDVIIKRQRESPAPVTGLCED
jgi:hypothetical protein